MDMLCLYYYCLFVLRVLTMLKDCIQSLLLSVGLFCESRGHSSEQDVQMTARVVSALQYT
jgi:hypothetical protein